MGAGFNLCCQTNQIVEARGTHVDANAKRARREPSPIEAKPSMDESAKPEDALQYLVEPLTKASSN